MYYDWHRSGRKYSLLLNSEMNLKQVAYIAGPNGTGIDYAMWKCYTYTYTLYIWMFRIYLVYDNISSVNINKIVCPFCPWAVPMRQSFSKMAPFHTLSDPFRSFQFLSDCFRPFHTLSDPFGSFQALSGRFRTFQNVSTHFPQIRSTLHPCFWRQSNWH